MKRILAIITALVLISVAFYAEWETWTELTYPNVEALGEREINAICGTTRRSRGATMMMGW